MGKGLSEIVVLRPTAVFLSFLMSQLGEQRTPSLHLLNKNTTAYYIKKYSSKEETLNELERVYSQMFRYEICRWLGKDARNSIERSFLDFLCCFKLEFHSHVVCLESNAQQMLQLKPRIKLVQWLNKIIANEPDLMDIIDEVTLAQLTENATVILKNFKQLQEIKSFLHSYYKPLFECALKRITTQRKQWPQINTVQEFKQYFAIEIHTQLVSYAS